ncbi:hypothetical protein BKA62DRAFT_69267 [Auriculariales sp. MPI-PUGE-AT-0066]|nr:hypothetical protein BKA62DRAFT_69267 [Auriculariales sp. MPI-PUGE-AT-0066]
MNISFGLRRAAPPRAIKSADPPAPKQPHAVDVDATPVYEHARTRPYSKGYFSALSLQGPVPSQSVSTSVGQTSSMPSHSSRHRLSHPDQSNVFCLPGITASFKGLTTTGISMTLTDEPTSLVFLVTRPKIDGDAYTALRRLGSAGHQRAALLSASSPPASIQITSTASRRAEVSSQPPRLQRSTSSSSSTSYISKSQPAAVQAPPRKWQPRPYMPQHRKGSSCGDMTLLAMCGQLQNLPFADSDSDEDSDDDDDESDDEPPSLKTPRDKAVPLPPSKMLTTVVRAGTS